MTFNIFKEVFVMVFIDGVYFKLISLIHEYSGIRCRTMRWSEIFFLISHFNILENDPNQEDFIGNVVGLVPEADTFFTDLYFVGKNKFKWHNLLSISINFWSNLQITMILLYHLMMLKISIIISRHPSNRFALMLETSEFLRSDPI